MALPHALRRAGALVPPSSPRELDRDPVLVARWLLEAWLTRARWGAALLCLLLIPLAPVVPWWACVLLALGLGLGNAAIASMLRQEPGPVPLRLIGWYATALEWAATLAAAALLVREPYVVSPAVFLLLILTAGLRYKFAGIVGSALGASIALVVMVWLKHRFVGVLSVGAAQDLLLIWGCLIALMALLAGVVVCARERYDHLMRSLAHPEEPAISAHQHVGELTLREMALLPWLARADLTYKAIGAALSIEPTTVKSHVQHIGDKLGVPGSRWIVVEAARARGLLPPTETRQEP